MKAPFAVLALSLVFAASNARSSELFCLKDSNSDWYLSIHVEDGQAVTASLNNQDWGMAGNGPDQALSLLANKGGVSEYVITNGIGPNLGLSKGVEIHISDLALKTGNGPVKIVDKSGGAVVYTEDFSCF